MSVFSAAAFTPRITAQEVAPVAPLLDEKQSEEPDDKVLELETLVVSATIAPKRPMESPASITTIDIAAIKTLAPAGGPELLKSIPGFYVESAGGEARANVRTRGLASPGGYWYAGLQEDGLPALSENRMRGTEPDMLIRLTNFVGRVEAIRGGAAGVFQDSTPGGIVNFINREGGSAHAGNLYLQGTDFGQIKAEIWDTGPLGGNTSYALYLGYRRDDGQKDVDYVANHGGSFSGNLKHSFADGRGYLKVSAKYTDEANLFWLPIPLTNASNPRSITGGVDIQSGSLYSAALKRPFSINTPAGAIAPDAQANAGRARTIMVTGDLDLKLGDNWKIKNLARFTYVNYHNDVPFLSGVATPLQTLANSIAAGAGAQFAAAKNGNNYAYRLYEGGTAVAAPTALNGNGLGILQSFGQSEADIDNFQNDLRLVRTISDGGAIAVGLYAGFMNSTFLAYGNTTVNSISPSAKPLDFEYLDATTGQSLGYGTYQGVRQLSAAASFRHATSQREQFSPYLNIERTFGKWSIEAGARHEELFERVAAEMGAANNVNSLNPAAGGNNPALRNVTLGSGTWRQRSFHLQDTIWTTAVNYKFSNKLGSYVRYMNGYRMPLSGDMLNSIYSGTFDPGPTEKMQQWEAGLKYSTRKLSAFVTLIRTEQQNQAFVGNFAQPDGTLAQSLYYRDSNATSLEVEAFYTPIKPLTLHLIGTLQDVAYANDVFITGTNSTTGAQFLININGHRPVRVPKIFTMVNASYKLPEIAGLEPTLNADWEYLGQRFGDDGNLTNLPAYSQYNLGLSLKRGRVTYRALVKNLTNTLGFTEGDPRTAQIVGDPSAAYMNMRTIYPRSFLFSVDIPY